MLQMRVWSGANFMPAKYNIFLLFLSRCKKYNSGHSRSSNAKNESDPAKDYLLVVLNFLLVPAKDDCGAPGHLLLIGVFLLIEHLVHSASGLLANLS